MGAVHAAELNIPGKFLFIMAAVSVFPVAQIGKSMKARIKWVEEMTFLGESGSGHTVVIDGPPEHGGRNLGIRPMELMLQSLGGCSEFDVMLMLKKGRM